MRGGPGQARRAKLLSAGGCFVAKCRQVSGWPVCRQEKHCPSISHLLLLMPEKQELPGPPNPARQSLRSSDWPGLGNRISEERLSLRRVPVDSRPGRSWAAPTSLGTRLPHPQNGSRQTSGDGGSSTRCPQSFLTQPEFDRIVLTRPPLSHVPELGLMIRSKRTALVFTVMVRDVRLISVIFIPDRRTRSPWHCTLRGNKITQVTAPESSERH